MLAFEPEPGMLVDTLARYEELLERLADRRIDTATAARLVEACGPVPAVFHRAFDEIEDKAGEVRWGSNPYQTRFGGVTINSEGRLQETSLVRPEVQRAGNGTRVIRPLQHARGSRCACDRFEESSRGVSIDE